MLAAQAIRAGDADAIVAGGMDSMSNAPHYVYGYRGGVKLGDQTLVDGMIRDVSTSYLQADDHGATIDLADPLVALERGPVLDRPLPPFFAPVGTRDPLLDDPRRLARALAALDVPCEARYYPGGIHAFHALVWDPAARRCWRDALAFLDRHLRPGARAHARTLPAQRVG